MNRENQENSKLHFKTIILSDLHLGSPYCQVEKVINFLNSTTSETLILNGDVIDGWSLARKRGWNNRFSRCLKVILNKINEDGTRVIYIRGNHDDFLDQFIPFTFDQLEIVREFEYHTREGTYLIIHGDGFDSVTTNHKWLALAGDIGYQIMMKSNALYNNHGHRFNLPEFSISKWSKCKVKSAVAFIDKYEEQLQKLAASRNYQGIICGHIHTPADKKLGSFHYINSGDWVESNTAVIEHYEGGFEVIDYDIFLKWKSGAIADLLFKKKKRKNDPAPDLDFTSSQ